MGFFDGKPAKKSKKVKKKKSKKVKKMKWVTAIVQKYDKPTLRLVKCDHKGRPLRDGGIMTCNEAGMGMDYLRGYAKQGGVRIVKVVKLKSPPKQG